MTAMQKRTEGRGRRLAGFVRWGGLCLATGILGLACLMPQKGEARETGQQLSADEARLTKEFDEAIYPLIEKYCWSCHNDDNKRGDFSFDAYADAKEILADQRQWEKVIMNVRSEVMPPPGMAMPSREERQKIVDFLQRVYTLNCDVVQAGRVTIRRLNQAEYNNTVRDLLGVDLTPADDFPRDDVGYGFNNIGDVLTLSPIHLEKYMDAARALSEAAIQVPRTYQLTAEMVKLPRDGNITEHESGGVFFLTNGTVDWRIQVDHAGMYRLTLVAGETRGGDDHAKMAVSVGRTLVQTVEVKAPGDQPIEYVIPLELAAGEHVIRAAFINDFYDTSLPPNRRDRNLVLASMSVSGPEGGARPALSDSHRRLIYRTPLGGNDASVVKELLTNFGTRAYRRPILPEEVDRLYALYRKVRENGESFERGMQICVQAVLVNPHFLFRVELDNKTDEGNDRVLNGYETASRLSYFLWSSMPDEELFAVARSGELTKPEVLRKQVERMLKHEKANRFAENFALQWLELKRIVEVLPDPELFGEFSEGLKDDLLQETELFFMDMIQQNRKIDEFISSEYTFLNKRLAEHYGIEGVAHEEFRRVNVKKHRRGGLFGMGSVLAVTSNPNRTSPVKRGKWVMEAILGTPPPPPPPDVGVLTDDQEAITTKNIRERMLQHTTDPSCGGCHKPLDAIGFTMENFDAVGRWRTEDGPFKVDPTGEMPDGTVVDGIDDLKRLVMQRKDDFSRSLVERMMIYAVGRGMDASDGCLIDDVVEQTAKRGNKMQDLIMEVILSDAFMKRTVTGGATSGGTN